MKSSSFLGNWISSALIVISISSSAATWGQVRGGTMSVVVVNVDGAPLHDARVRLTPVHQPKKSFPTSADGQGRFRFSGLPSGDYFVEVSHRLFGPRRQRQIAIREGAILELTVEMGRGCSDGLDDKGAELPAGDRAVVINLALQEAHERLLSADERQRTVTVSTRNLQVEWLSSLKATNLVFLSPRSLEEQAEHMEGLPYLEVSEISSVGLCLVVTVEHVRFAKKQSSVVYLSGAGIKFEFRKHGEKWIGERIMQWVS